MFKSHPEKITQPTRRLVFAGVLFIVGLLATQMFWTGPRSVVSAQDQRTPVPLVTLVPPTLVPPPPPPTATPSLTQSALAHIKADNKLNVGFLYNAGRFSTLTDIGIVDGFEPDLAQAIADDWGVTLNPVQVTRQDGRNLLLSGQIDLLMGEVILSRDDQTGVDYSDPYFINKEVALANSDFAGKSITDLAGQTIGVVQGSRGEQAFNSWMQSNGLSATINRYPLLDGVGSALSALASKQVTAVIGDRWELDQRAGNGIMQDVKLLDGIFQSEPYAIAMRRYDDNLRTLVERTMQRLVESKRLEPIYDANFPAELLPPADRPTVPIWTGLDNDKRAVADFPTDIIMPAQPVLAKIKAGQPLRVAGIGAPPDPNGKQPLLDAFNQAMINELTRRWGVQVQLVPDSYGKAEDMLASGAADLGVGVEPHWGTLDSPDRIDYAGIYGEHSYRMMIPFGSSAVRSFGDLLATRRQIGYFSDDPGALDIAKKYAGQANIVVSSIVPVPLNTDQDAIDRLTNDHTANIVFADSLRLYPILQAFPKFVQLTDTEYGGGKQIAFGVPRNDADFRTLIDITLQDMARDGTYQKIWDANLGFGTPLTMIVWPGSSQPFGIKTSG